MLPAFGTLGRVAVLIPCMLAACSGTERHLFSRVAPEDGVPPTTTGAGDAGSEFVGEADASSADAPVAEALDPDARFDWTESVPGVGTCRPGKYTGSFQCTIPGLVPFRLSGAITLTLGTTDEAQTLEIVEGSVVGVDNATGSDLLTAEVTGALDCDANRLLAQTENGHALPGIPFLPVRAFDQFDAMLDGKFDAATLAVAGTWVMTNQVGGTCKGTFRVSWSP